MSGNDFFQDKPMFPRYGADVPYYECGACDFILTLAFENWTREDYAAHIYNDDYIHADPLFVSERPLRNAQLIQAMFYRDFGDIDILDFGGGEGLMSRALMESGYKAESFDIFYGLSELPLGRQFDLVTSFEVIEHVPSHEQHAWMQRVACLLKKTPEARVLLTTDLWSERSAFDRWFICPRNGHMSIHSAQSLNLLAARFGLAVTSVSSAIHLLSWQNLGLAWSARTPAVLAA